MMERVCTCNLILSEDQNKVDINLNYQLNSSLVVSLYTTLKIAKLLMLGR